MLPQTRVTHLIVLPNFSFVQKKDISIVQSHFYFCVHKGVRTSWFNKERNPLSLLVAKFLFLYLLSI